MINPLGQVVNHVVLSIDFEFYRRSCPIDNVAENVQLIEDADVIVQADHPPQKKKVSNPYILRGNNLEDDGLVFFIATSEGSFLRRMIILPSQCMQARLPSILGNSSSYT